MPEILLADDHQQMRRQLRSLLESVDNWTVSAEAEDGANAVARYAEVHPKITVMDFHMPGLNGLEASRKILEQDPSAAILMLTVHTSKELASEAKKVGIKGFCAKSQMKCILDAVSGLLRGEEYFPEFN